MTSQKEDLYRFLYLQYLEEPQRVKPIPIFEFRNKMICELVFSAANQFDLNTEVYCLALQYFERYIEEIIHTKSRFDANSLNFDMIASIQIASKQLSNAGSLWNKTILRFYPAVTSDFLLENELRVLKILLENLGRPTFFTAFGVIWSCISSKVVHPSELKYFKTTADKVFFLIWFNRYSLFLQLHKHLTGRNAESKEEFHNIRVMFRDHIFLSAATIVVVSYICNLDVQIVLFELHQLTNIRPKTLDYFAKIVLKGISDASS